MAARDGPDGRNRRDPEAEELGRHDDDGDNDDGERDEGAYAEAPAAARRADPDGEDEEGTEDPGLRDDGKLCVSGPSTLLMVPIIFLQTLQTMQLFGMMPSVAAMWFAHCDPEREALHECKPNYPTAQAVSGAVDSVTNLFAFFSGALLGRLSDVYGRRPLLVLALLISSLPTIALAITNGNSPYAYYSSVVLSGILGNSNMGTLLMSLFNAYIADVYTVRVRTSQLGIMAGMAALGMVVSPVLTSFTAKLHIAEVAKICIVINAALVVYILVFVHESLPAARRNSFTLGRTLNPLAPIKLISQSSIMRWVALVYFLAMLPEAGVREIMLSYVDEVLDLDEVGAREFSTTIFALFGALVFLLNVIVLPFLERAHVLSSSLLSLSQVCNSFHMVVYACLHIFPYRGILYANAIPTSFALFINVSSNSLISSAMGPKEQGFALGTLAAVGGLASVIGPFAFSQAFAYFSRTLNEPQIPFIAGSVFAAVAACLSICGPLRSLETTSKRILVASHSRLYEDHPNLRDDVLDEDVDLDASDLETPLVPTAAPA